VATTDYWVRTLRHRISRRRALAISVVGGAAALSAWGCGGGSEETEPSGLLHKPSETTNTAQRGGTWLSFEPADPGGLDPRTSINVRTYSVAYHVYSRLFRNKAGVLSAPAGTTEPDLVEKYELSGDGTQLTLHLRKNAYWDDRAPTSGRVLSSEDVRTSWEKFSTEHPSRVELSYAASKASAIESPRRIRACRARSRHQRPPDLVSSGGSA
jgi:ABC-type transport system substrate-binding protein